MIDTCSLGVRFSAIWQGNFSIPLAAECIRQGLFPDTISTDLNIPNWDSPLVFSLLMTMSKFLALGLPLEEVIRAVTCRPAAVMGMEGELGTLKEGTTADISVLQLAEKQTMFRDKYGNQIIAEKKFMPLATVISGRMQYQSSDTLCWDGKTPEAASDDGISHPHGFTI